MHLAEFRRQHAIVDDAYKFARKAHDGQLRSGGAAYFTHPVRVTQNLLDAGVTDATIITASLLHDVAEDCYPSIDAGIKEIQRVFGPDVAQLVDNLSRHPEQDKTEYLASFHQKDPRAGLIKLSDRCDNLADGAIRSKSWQRKYADQALVLVNAIQTHPDKAHLPVDVFIQRIQHIAGN